MRANSRPVSLSFGVQEICCNNEAMEREHGVFKSDPQRDAYGVIAGFIYQINTTMERWLELKDGEVLELERGEDIDVIQTAVRGGRAERVLEQTKRRTTARVTLKSSESLEAIANFCIHRDRNPEIDLRFRFITNADAGVEKDWPDDVGGIPTWEGVRRDRLVGTARVEAVRKLSAFLAGCEWPAALEISGRPPAVAFRDEAFVDSLIERFEWSTGGRDYPAIADQIKSLLRSHRYCDSAAAAQQIFERLFVYVMERLAEQGVKRLTPEELLKEVAAGAASERDRLLFKLVHDLEELERRVSMIEMEMPLMKATIEGLQTEQKVIIAALAKNEGIDVSIRMSSLILALDKPELVSPLIERDRAVAGVVGILATTTFLVLVGEPGSGKTQLCLLSAVAIGRDVVWIALPRGGSEDRASVILDDALQSLLPAGKNFMGLRELYASATKAVRGKLLVIDDLPNMVPGGALAERVETLVKAAAQNDVTLLGTSYYSLPTFKAAVVEKEAPRLVRAEVEELLLAYGCPPAVVNGFANLMESLSHGLAVLVVAGARYCQEQAWKITPGNFAAIFGAEFAKGIKRDAKKMVELTIKDEGTRELLYRLSLAIGGFSRERAEKVAAVKPPISLVGEKLDRLTGLWVQPYSGDRLIQSPLVDSSFGSSLDGRTRAGVHAVYANDILASGELHPIDVMTCVYHLNMAGLVNHAALVLIQALLLLTDDEFDQEMEFVGFWTKAILLPETDINLRVYAKALQAVALDMRGESIEPELTDVLNLIDEAGPSSYGAVIAAGTLGIRLFKKFPQITNKCALIAIRGFESAKLPGDVSIPTPAGPALEGLFWATANAVRSDADVESWIQAIGQLRKDEIERMARSELAADNACILTDGIWLREWNKEGPKDWARVQSLVSRLEKVGEDSGLTVLRAAATRTLIMIRAEMLGHMDQALEIAKSALEKVADDESIFLITEVTGRQLWYSGRTEEAIEWLKRARSIDVVGHALWKRNALVTLAEAVETKDVSAGVPYVKEALALSRAELIPHRVIESLGEYALALWHSGDRTGAFAACEEAVRRLLECEEPDSSWVKLFIGVFGVATYLSSMASYGRPPDIENYLAPKQGHFLGQFDAKYFVEAQKAFIRMKVAIFANAVGEMDKVSLWLNEAFAIAGEIPGARSIYALGWLGIAPAIAHGDYGEAVRMALLSADVRFQGDRAAREGGFADPERLKETMETPTWAFASSMALSIGLAASVATLRVRGGNDTQIKTIIDAVRVASRGDERIGTVADALSDAFLGGLGWRELRKKGREEIQRSVGVGMVYYVACTLKRPLEQCLYMQAWLEKELGKSASLLRAVRAAIVWPLLRLFWLDALSNESEQFRTSEAYTRRQVEEFARDQSFLGVKRLLKAMYFCLGVSNDDAELETWFNEV